MIISGGLNVFPVDIEAVLLEHDDVRDASVVGVPDERWGETPVAFVVARPEIPIDGGALMTWANGGLARFQRLADLVVTSTDFPRNALGKVLKSELRERYLASRPGADPRTEAG